MVLTTIYIILAVLLLTCLITTAVYLTRFYSPSGFENFDRIKYIGAAIVSLIGIFLFGAYIVYVATHSNQVSKSFSEMIEYIAHNPLVSGSTVITLPAIMLIYMGWTNNRK